MSILCFLSQYPISSRKPSKNRTSGEEGAQFSRRCEIPRSEKKGEAPHVRPPLLNEPVGGRLIGVLYCHPRRKSFHFFLSGGIEEKANERHVHTPAMPSRDVWTLQIWPRLPRPCFASPPWGPL